MFHKLEAPQVHWVWQDAISVLSGGWEQTFLCGCFSRHTISACAVHSWHWGGWRTCASWPLHGAGWDLSERGRRRWVEGDSQVRPWIAWAKVCWGRQMCTFPWVTGLPAFYFFTGDVMTDMGTDVLGSCMESLDAGLFVMSGVTNTCSSWPWAGDWWQKRGTGDPLSLVPGLLILCVWLGRCLRGPPWPRPSPADIAFFYGWAIASFFFFNSLIYLTLPGLSCTMGAFSCST